MSSLKQFLDTHTNISSSAEKFIAQYKLHRCILLLIVFDCEDLCVVAGLFISFMVFVITTGSLRTVDCCGLKAKDAFKRPFLLQYPSLLLLLMQMQRSTYGPLAKTDIGPHSTVFKSSTFLELFEFLYSPLVYVTFFLSTYLSELLPRKTTVN